MTATAAISTLRSQIQSSLASRIGLGLWQWVSAGSARLQSLLRGMPEGTGAGSFRLSCPQALPGFNQSAVERTWRLSGRRMLCTDGRQRLAGEQTLDICATPREMPRAIASFACWLDYLAADGIGVEIRKLDGWRTCAMVDGVPVPIRVRERMRRVSGGSSLSARIERMLGGYIPSVLAPSGKVELQLLRMGVAFASFPLPEMPTPALLERVSESIRGMAKREVEYRERMHAAAVAETAKRRTAKPGKATQPEAQPRFSAQPATGPVPTATEVALLSAYSAGRLTQMLETLQVALGETSRGAGQQSVATVAGSPADATQMAESMVSLATAMQAASAAPAPAFSARNGVAMITAGSPKASKSRRTRRSHVA
jgi:hypothetical protein